MTRPTFRRTIFILADGTRYDVFRQLLAEGRLPAIERHLVAPGSFREAIAAFPTVSGPGHLPFMTGCFPGTLNIPGIYWFDRQVYARSILKLRGFRSYLGPFKVAKMTRDVAAGTPTLAQVWPDAWLVFAWYRRGLPRAANRTRWTKSISFLRGLWTRDWLQCDRDAERVLMNGVEAGASFVFAVFPAADELGHRFGPTSDEARAAYLRLDGTIERLFERLAARSEDRDTLVMIGSDHGQSPTSNHFDLDRFVAERVGRTMVYKRFATPRHRIEAVVLPSGNGMANVYFRGPGWSAGRPDLTRAPWDRLLRELLEQPPVDILAFRDQEWVRAISRRGLARFRWISRDRVEYAPEDGDPFGYDGLRGCLGSEEWIEATASAEYPDGPIGLLTLLRSERSGDLIVTSRPGHDLRSWFEYQEPHGTHGSLHHEHSRVPVIVNARLRPGALRTVDVFPTLCDLAARRCPDGVEGVSRAG